MASWEHLAAMLRRSPSPLSKVSQAGPRARKTSFSHVDSKSVLGRERGKQFFENEGAMQECC